jgi:hypothetical protein
MSVALSDKPPICGIHSFFIRQMIMSRNRRRQLDLLRLAPGNTGFRIGYRWMGTEL